VYSQRILRNLYQQLLLFGITVDIILYSMALTYSSLWESVAYKVSVQTKT